MTKNGFFILSIGLLVFVFSVNRQTNQYDLFSMVTGLILIIVGSVVAYRGSKKTKEKKQEKIDEDMKKGKDE